MLKPSSCARGGLACVCARDGAPRSRRQDGWPRASNFSRATFRANPDVSPRGPQSLTRSGDRIEGVEDFRPGHETDRSAQTALRSHRAVRAPGNRHGRQHVDRSHSAMRWCPPVFLSRPRISVGGRRDRWCRAGTVYLPGPTALLSARRLRHRLQQCAEPHKCMDPDRVGVADDLIPKFGPLLLAHKETRAVTVRQFRLAVRLAVSLCAASRY